MHNAGVNLPHLYQRPGAAVFALRSDTFQKQLAIALNVLFVVVLGEAEIQCLAAVTGRNPALPCAESMDQPLQSDETFRA